MSEHTPGPWEIESIDSAPDDHLRIMGRPVWPCTRFGAKGVWDIASVNELGDENVDEQIANARLIAAAPDMLEALRAILPGKLCGEGWNLPDDELVQIMVTFADLRAARAAIATATGEV